ncbi:MAG: RNA polymerase sigma-70 factor [Sphingobacteriia bacterium]|nr:RNA polymerase sigma-70 factor [Sphingobacteriia bacterium]
MLLQKIAKGDSKSFAVLFEHYYPSLLSFIAQYVKSSFLADDIAQDVFIKIWDGREKLTEVEHFGAWLFTIARNQTFNTLKAAGRSEAILSKLLEQYIPVQASSTEDRVLTRDYQAFLEKQLLQMPERTRDIFKRCREMNQSYEEVAQELGISRNAVKNHMVFAHKELKTAVFKEYGISLGLFFAAIGPFQLPIV